MARPDVHTSPFLSPAYIDAPHTPQIDHSLPYMATANVHASHLMSPGFVDSPHTPQIEHTLPFMAHHDAHSVSLLSPAMVSGSHVLQKDHSLPLLSSHNHGGSPFHLPLLSPGMVSGIHVLQKDHSLPLLSHSSPFTSSHVDGGFPISNGFHHNGFGHSFGFARSAVPKLIHAPSPHQKSFQEYQRFLRKHLQTHERSERQRNN